VFGPPEKRDLTDLNEATTDWLKQLVSITKVAVPRARRSFDAELSFAYYIYHSNANSKVITIMKNALWL